MSWIQKLLEGNDQPIAREVSWEGNTATAYFRRISAAERMKLVQGQRVATKGGQAEIEVDLGAQEVSKHRMVQFSCCTADGAREFAHIKEVEALPGALVNALFKIAVEINRDEAEDALGKE